MKYFILFALLATQLSFAQDQVARIQDNTIRGNVLKAQLDAMSARMEDDADQSCEAMLAPLPARTGTMPFKSATTAIEKNYKNISMSYPPECINILLQDLAAVSPTTPPITRILALLGSLERQYHGTSEEARVCSVQTSGIEELLSLAESAQSVTTCAPLQIDKWKKVSGMSAHGRQTDYSMQKSAHGVRIALNINFALDSAAAAGVAASDRVSNDAMMARARGCMQAVQGLIKDPEGKPIQFDLLTPTEARRLPLAVRPGVNNVQINHSADFRSNAANYAHTADCPTIVHEVLHLLGLCDEYAGEADGSLCRATPLQNNIMSDTFETFNTSVPRTVTCECKDDLCASALARPGRIDFMKAPRWADRTSSRFRNTYCSESTGTPLEPWANENVNPPSPAFSSTLAADGLSIVMNDAYMYAEDWEQIFRNSITCTCPAGDTNCISTIANIANEKLPAITRSCPMHMEIKDFVWGPGPENDQLNGRNLTYTVTPSEIPLLHPVHVQRVLDGVCTTKSKAYNDCSKNAYAQTAEACADAPAACSSPNFLNR